MAYSIRVFATLAALIPGARFVVLPHAGHSSSLEQPEAVTAALREFFHSA